MPKPPRAKKPARIPEPVSFGFTVAAADLQCPFFSCGGPLCTASRRGYNHFVARSCLSLKVGFLVVLCAGWWLASCAAPLGPGYVVQQQEIRVSFLPAQQAIQIAAEYRLQNTGNQPLDSLHVRMPGRRFRPASIQVSWDAATLAQNVSPDNPRDRELRFPELWKIGETHTLKFSYDIPVAPPSDSSLGFSADAFYLPAETWAPRLPPARGVFGFGGVPPKQWLLTVSLPEGLLVHASGGKEKRSAKAGLAEYRFTQTAEDLNPFVVAGRYTEFQQTLAPDQKIHVWTRGKLDPSRLRDSGESLSRTLAAYDALLGARGKSRPPVWIVECPAPSGCISQQETGYSQLLYGRETARSAEMISQDSVVVDAQLSAGALETSAGPALAAGWLGYGQNPGFYEQQPPMSALPAFAAALAREASGGPVVRSEIISRALAAVPQHAVGDPMADPAVIRAKSLLLFYALRDRVGPDYFQKAIQHMLYARQRRGFNVTDLISALEQESHQTLGPFVRQWIKHPGVPEEFRAVHSQTASQQQTSRQETTQ
jgi:hypothetical protein